MVYTSSGPSHLDKAILRPEGTPAMAAQAGLASPRAYYTKRLRASRTAASTNLLLVLRPPVLGLRPLAHTSNPFKITDLDLSDTVLAVRGRTVSWNAGAFRGGRGASTSGNFVRDKIKLFILFSLPIYHPHYSEVVE